MTKIIDGEGAIMGRLASYAAKEALKGEEIVILNSEKVIITGNRENIKADFEASRTRIGSGQKGPKVSRSSEKILKRVIRGMLPDHRKGRGKIALAKIKCYIGIPKEFQGLKKISGGKEVKGKFITIEELKKQQ
ncbi:50S ribosomal protein L13 [Candidatus Pacearchaeota archaeon]|nr:50S ribosomal protein L13 [Candidatus Pacearchaeota archaeon]